MIASAKEIDALNITLFNSCINFTNVHLCNYCTKIFVIVVKTCVCRRSVDNKALIPIKGTTLVVPSRSAVLWEKRFTCMGAGTFKRTRAPETVYLKAPGM